MDLAGLAPMAADMAPQQSTFDAHRQLVEALLHAGEPAAGPRSYALLWQRAAGEQERAGRTAQEAEHVLEMLVTEILALSRTVQWFGSRPELREAAIDETVAYWTGDPLVDSAAAHESWRGCWEWRTRVTQSADLGPAELVAAVAAEQRLQREWAARWEAWAWQPAPAAVPA